MGIAIKGEVSDNEKRAYIEYLQKKHNRKLAALDIDIDGEYVDLHYKFEPIGFERIRRITGYLVGTMDQWNDAKKAEEADRVKHATTQVKLERI
ncbi:MAG: anaerobic ribonucleoside-triphosphate reductase [Eubacteriales bacterium]|nr:anaerobic ribonucleoside-triphosphate reductase [Eubacteriales bacterium]MDD4390270.1 anaerobic ribonucleoside-triphosphate reductase [Eubacteriales bacterium]